MNFTPSVLVRNLSDTPKIADMFNSLPRVARELSKHGYNIVEAEAFLRSSFAEKAVMFYGRSSGDLLKYLNEEGFTPGSSILNALTLADNPNLELNADGVVCRRGTMPGNPAAGTVLVPVGTPLCCDPTSETYWSM
jgi:hypothetical protein